MTNPSQVTYTAIASNKGKPRIWIEGAKLSNCGFTRGAQYSVCDLADSVLRLELDPNGRRVVSGRTRNGKDTPIIDLNMPWLRDKFGDEAKLRVVFTQGAIEVTLHHEEAKQEAREERVINNIKANTLTSATLCSGAGVSTLALHDSAVEQGFTPSVKWVVDMELKYLQVASSNNYAITDDTAMIIGKIEEVEPQFYTPVDVLHVSLDCAGLSGAGRSKHKLDPTEHKSAPSLFGLVNAIKSANPAVVISENVTEAYNSPMYQLLTAELERTGYRVFHKTMTGEETPTFETRRRYWLVAISDGVADGFDWVDLLGTHAVRTFDSLKDDNVPGSMWCENTYLKEKAVTDAAAGKGFRRQLLTGNETQCGTIGKHYAKKRSTEPFVVREDGKERLFTKLEHCRVKEIPEVLVKDVLPTVAHQILGQSVDFLQAMLVGTSVYKHLNLSVTKR